MSKIVKDFLYEKESFEIRGVLLLEQEEYPDLSGGGGRFSAVSYRPVRFAATPPILGGELRGSATYQRTNPPSHKASVD